jgi:CTP:molybdopterin cytidylyltransferase MocA
LAPTPLPSTRNSIHQWRSISNGNTDASRPRRPVGIQAETIYAMRQFADAKRPQAIRPVHRGLKGRIAWISAAVAKSILAATSTPEGRLDQFIDPVAQEIEIGDGAILNNVNTPEDWERLKL